jgi:hypothetical protein
MPWNFFLLSLLATIGSMVRLSKNITMIGNAMKTYLSKVCKKTYMLNSACHTCQK